MSKTYEVLGTCQDSSSGKTLSFFLASDGNLEFSDQLPRLQFRSKKAAEQGLDKLLSKIRLLGILTQVKAGIFEYEDTGALSL